MRRDGILLLFLSEYKAGTQTGLYTAESPDGAELQFEGTQTNDAPVKFLITRALENGSVIRKIHSIHCIYDMFQLLSGVSQFVSTGNAEFLQACYEKEEDRDTRELLEQIVRFSHVMSLCGVEKVDQIMEDLSRSLDQYDERQEKGKEIAYSIQSRRRKAATFHSQKCAWDAHFCENMIPAGNV